MSEQNSIVAIQFEDAEQQSEAAHLGMWVFLATEVLFFGALFMAYLIYRHFYPHDFAIASKHTELLFGSVNSVILLTSSLTMALAVHAAKANYRRQIVPWLLASIVLGLSFLSAKGLEYDDDIARHLVPGAHFDPTLPPHAQLFFWLYWTMTGLHAVHLTVGLGVLTVMTFMAREGKFSSSYNTPLTLAGIYWAFVDIVWVFLFAIIYVVDRHS